MNVLIRIISIALASALVSKAVVCMDKKRILDEGREDRQEIRDVRQRRVEAPCSLLTVACDTARRAAENARKVANAAVSFAATLYRINMRLAERAAARAPHPDVASYNHAWAHARAFPALLATDQAAVDAYDAGESAHEAARNAADHPDDVAAHEAARHAAEVALATADDARAAARVALAAASISVDLNNAAVCAAATAAEAARVNPKAIAHLPVADFARTAGDEATQAASFAECVSEAVNAAVTSQHGELSSSAAHACDATDDFLKQVKELIDPERSVQASRARVWADRAIAAALRAEAVAKLDSDDPLEHARVVHSATDAAQCAAHAYSKAVECLREIRHTCQQPLHANCESPECCLLYRGESIEHILEPKEYDAFITAKQQALLYRHA